MAAVVLVAALISGVAGAGNETAPSSGQPDRFSKACGLVADGDKLWLDRACMRAMAFDPEAYFGSNDGAEQDPLAPSGLVDAVFLRALHGPGWAFAIANGCPGLAEADPTCKSDQRRPLLRAVTIKPPEEIPAAYNRSPKSEAEMRGLLNAVMNWREADLRTCPGAVEALLALDDVRWQPFDEADQALITGQSPAQLLVIADPDTISVRAGGVMNAHAAHDMGQPGGAGAWAMTMRAVVEPCLKPTGAPPPWSDRAR
jgi:hypothetical protein